MQYVRSLQVGSVVVLVVMAGCLGGLGSLVSGEDLVFSAGTVGISETAVAQSGFVVASDKPITFERTIEVQGQSRTVVMNAHIVNLQREYKGAPLGSVVVLALPQFRVLGQQIDLAERFDPASFVGQAQSSADGLNRQQKIGERTVRILGQDRTVEVFSGNANVEGQSVPVNVYLTTFEYEGDTIVAAGVIPEEAPQDAEAVLALFEGIEHERA